MVSVSEYSLLFFCSVSTAAYLAAYIVDLILVLYEISMVMTVDPPKRLTADLVMDARALWLHIVLDDLPPFTLM